MFIGQPILHLAKSTRKRNEIINSLPKKYFLNMQSPKSGPQKCMSPQSAAIAQFLPIC